MTTLFSSSRSTPLSHIFDDLMTPVTVTRYIPPMDVISDEDRSLITMDVPGLTEDDLSLELKDNVLIISGERTTEANRSGSVERRFGRFERRIRVPAQTTDDDIQANLERGVLTVSVARREPEVRKIAIKVSDQEQLSSAETSSE